MMDNEEEPRKKRLPWEVIGATIAITIVVELICLCVFGAILQSVNDAEQRAQQESEQQQSQNYSGAADESTPEPSATKQPLIKYRDADYPCSHDLYKIRTYNVFQDESGPDVMAYCKKIKAAVDALPSMSAKLNHLVIEYCKAGIDPDTLQSGDTLAKAQETSLNDIYGSFYGALKVAYDKESDSYGETWFQKATNGRSAYMGSDRPSLEQPAGKYCPAPSDTPQTVPTGTRQG